MRNDATGQDYGIFGLHRLTFVRVDPRVRRLTSVLGLVAVVSIAGFGGAPWRQSVTGSGRTVAYAPTERVQELQAPVTGRIDKWYVVEGSHVQVGDPVVDIADNDPNYLARLEQQRRAAERRVDAARTAVTINEHRVAALQTARSAAVTSAELLVGMARDHVVATKNELEGAEAEHTTAGLNHRRLHGLGQEGLASKRSVDVASLELQTKRSLRDAARAKVRVSRSEVAAAGAKFAYVVSTEDARIGRAQGALQKHRSDLAAVKGALAKVESIVSRQQRMKVVAPVEGTVLSIIANGDGQYVEQGERLARIVPDTSSRAVEMWISGKDVPLITKGRNVRLHFQGWPVVQFVGWPSLAVGTFGGKVAFLDATDDGSGKLRIVVVPDPDDEPWPDVSHLRQGIRAQGWVLLNEVTMAFEVWRQLNGFQPVVDAPGS